MSTAISSSWFRPQPVKTTPPPSASDLFKPQPSSPQPKTDSPSDWFRATPAVEPASVPQPPPASLETVTLNSAQQAVVAALPGPLGAAFAHVFAGLESLPQAQSQMLGLLEQGKLTQDQGQGSVVERLQQLTTEERAPGVDGWQLTQQSIALLANPDQGVFQGMRSTCGAANVQRQLAEQPAVMMELVENLSDRQGVAQLPTGARFERVPNSAAEDGSGRDLLNRILQSSLMAVAGAQRGPYDFATGCFGDDPVPGLKPLEMAVLTAATSGKDQVVVIHDGQSTRQLREILGQLPAGTSVQCGLSWRGMDGTSPNSRDHMLLLTGLEEGTVRFFDPESQAQGQMPLHDFLFKTQFILLPHELVEGRDIPEDNLYRPLN